VSELLLQFFGKLFGAVRMVVLLFHAGLDAALGPDVEGVGIGSIFRASLECT
jgi:hypothetical protein